MAATVPGISAQSGNGTALHGRVWRRPTDPLPTTLKTQPPWLTMIGGGGFSTDRRPMVFAFTIFGTGTAPHGTTRESVSTIWFGARPTAQWSSTATAGAPFVSVAKMDTTTSMEAAPPPPLKS